MTLTAKVWVLMNKSVKFLVGTLGFAAACMIVPFPPGALADNTSGADAKPPRQAQHIVRSTVNYVVPPVNLVRDDGKPVLLTEELNDGRPVFMNFIFTTCTAICPLASHTFSQLQRKLGGERDKVHMVSISIDPEQDTPSHLAEYAKKYQAGPQWQHYTGSMEASLAVQRAFDAYRGDKMNHSALTLLRTAPGKPWLRVDGFATADDLLREYHGLVDGK